MDLDYRRNRITPLVFVGTPTSSVKDYAWEQFYSRLKALTYKRTVFWVADNSNGNDYANKLRKLGINVAKIKPKNKTNIEFVCESFNVLRELFLKSNATYFLSYESDVKPPQNVIERLLICNKKVVSGTYFIGLGTGSHLMIVEKEDKSNNTQHTIMMDKGYDMLMVDGKLHKVMNGGLGCTLIHRSVMENIKFRYEKDIYAHPDTFFSIDLFNAGIEYWVDTSIMCEHLNSEWIHF